MTERRPGSGRYARPEREQRWIVRDDPPSEVFVASIVDHDIRGTTLRLRRAERAGSVDLKLAQKVRIDPEDPQTVRLTNLYLDQVEYDLLARLPAARLEKGRSHTTWRGRTVAVDRFAGPLAGLVLAEVQLAADEPLLAAPPWVRRDVTTDDRYTGGSLAASTVAEAAALLSELSS